MYVCLYVCVCVCQSVLVLDTSPHVAVPLLSPQDRLSILHIHTQQWDPPLKQSFLCELAELTVGYCGADLRALCTEAALHSLRRQYPQIYNTSDKLIIDPSKIKVSAVDFHSALKALVPTSQRSNSSLALSLSDTVFPLLGEQFLSLLSLCAFVFPQAWRDISRAQSEVSGRLRNEEERRREMVKLVEELTGNGGGTTVAVEGRRCVLSDNHAICSLPRAQPTSSSSSSSSSSTTTFCACALSTLGDTSRGGGGREVSKRTFSTLSTLPYQATRQLVALDDIFFDLSDTSVDQSPSMDILVQDSSTTDASCSNSNVTRGFISLSSNPHILPPTHRPRLLLAGRQGWLKCFVECQ